MSENATAQDVMAEVAISEFLDSLNDYDSAKAKASPDYIPFSGQLDRGENKIFPRGIASLFLNDDRFDHVSAVHLTFTPWNQAFQLHVPSVIRENEHGVMILNLVEAMLSVGVELAEDEIPWKLSRFSLDTGKVFGSIHRNNTRWTQGDHLSIMRGSTVNIINGTLWTREKD